MLERYLEDLESRIDADAEETLLAEWQSFADGDFRGDLFSPRRTAPAPPAIEWPDVPVNDALEDFERMALQQLADCSRALESGNSAFLAVRCNYGTAIMPSLFGARLFVMDEATNTLPTTEPLAGGEDAIRDVVAGGVPDLRAGLGERVFEMAERFTEWLAPYPGVRRYVHVYHPDMQGPMDICEMLWGSGLFLALCDVPDLVHALLEVVTETYTRFMQDWNRLIPPGDGYAVHWAMLHKGRIMLRDDSAMNLSPDMFAEFVEPYDQRLLDAFGGGGLHFCGRGDHYVHRLPEMAGVYALAMSQPECNDMERIYRHTVDRGIPLIGFPREAAEAALRRGRDLHGNVHCW